MKWGKYRAYSSRVSLSGANVEALSSEVSLIVAMLLLLESG